MIVVKFNGEVIMKTKSITGSFDTIFLNDVLVETVTSHRLSLKRCRLEIDIFDIYDKENTWNDSNVQGERHYDEPIDVYNISNPEIAGDVVPIKDSAESYCSDISESADASVQDLNKQSPILNNEMTDNVFQNADTSNNKVSSDLILPETQPTRRSASESSISTLGVDLPPDDEGNQLLSKNEIVKLDLPTGNSVNSIQNASHDIGLLTKSESHISHPLIKEFTLLGSLSLTGEELFDLFSDGEDHWYDILNKEELIGLRLSQQDVSSVDAVASITGRCVGKIRLQGISFRNDEYFTYSKSTPDFVPYSESNDEGLNINTHTFDSNDDLMSKITISNISSRNSSFYESEISIDSDLVLNDLPEVIQEVEKPTSTAMNLIKGLMTGISLFSPNSKSKDNIDIESYAHMYNELSPDTSPLMSPNTKVTISNTLMNQRFLGKSFSNLSNLCVCNLLSLLNRSIGINALSPLSPQRLSERISNRFLSFKLESIAEVSPVNHQTISVLPSPNNVDNVSKTEINNELTNNDHQSQVFDNGELNVEYEDVNEDDDVNTTMNETNGSKPFMISRIYRLMAKLYFDRKPKLNAKRRKVVVQPRNVDASDIGSKPVIDASLNNEQNVAVEESALKHSGINSKATSRSPSRHNSIKSNKSVNINSVMSPAYTTTNAMLLNKSDFEFHNDANSQIVILNALSNDLDSSISKAWSVTDKLNLKTVEMEEQQILHVTKQLISTETHILTKHMTLLSPHFTMLTPKLKSPHPSNVSTDSLEYRYVDLFMIKAECFPSHHHYFSMESFLFLIKWDSIEMNRSKCYYQAIKSSSNDNSGDINLYYDRLSFPIALPKYLKHTSLGDYSLEIEVWHCNELEELSLHLSTIDIRGDDLIMFLSGKAYASSWFPINFLKSTFISRDEYSYVNNSIFQHLGAERVQNGLFSGIFEDNDENENDAYYDDDDIELDQLSQASGVMNADHDEGWKSDGLLTKQALNSMIAPSRLSMKSSNFNKSQSSIDSSRSLGSSAASVVKSAINAVGNFISNANDNKVISRKNSGKDSAKGSHKSNRGSQQGNQDEIELDTRLKESELYNKNGADDDDNIGEKNKVAPDDESSLDSFSVQSESTLNKIGTNLKHKNRISKFIGKVSKSNTNKSNSFKNPSIMNSLPDTVEISNDDIASPEFVENRALPTVQFKQNAKIQLQAFLSAPISLDKISRNEAYFNMKAGDILAANNGGQPSAQTEKFADALNNHSQEFKLKILSLKDLQIKNRNNQILKYVLSFCYIFFCNCRFVCLLTAEIYLPLLSKMTDIYYSGW